MPSPSRRLAIPLLLLVGCAAPPQQPEEGIKEVYVERMPGTEGLSVLRPFPFGPGTESRAYSVVLGFSAKTRSGKHYMGQLLEVDEEKTSNAKGAKPKGAPGPEKDGAPRPQKPGAPGPQKPEAPGPQKPGAPGPRKPEAPPDGELTTLEAKGDPSLLVFPEKIEVRDDGVCYLGHSAYARDPYAPRSRIIHHLRILLVNRRAAPLYIPLAQVMVARLSAAPNLDGQEKVAGSGLRFLAGADAQGRALEELVVAPGKVGQAHLFFLDDRLTPALDVRWKVHEAGPAVGGRDRPHWSFETALRRRYTVQKGLITPLELRVRDGWDLPESGPGIEVFNEPRVMPLAPAAR